MSSKKKSATFRRRATTGVAAGGLSQSPNWTERIVHVAAIVIGLAAFLCLPVHGLGGNNRNEASAETLLGRARAHRETLSSDFPGFRSRLTVWRNGETHQGRMKFRPPITLEVEFGEAGVRKAVKRTVRSLLAHRLAPTGSRNREDQVISYATEDNHPLGRRIFLGDKYGSTYRIRENRILEVDRNLEDSRLLITVMETETTAEGTYLPTHFFVVTFDKESGGVKQSSAYSDAYQVVGGEYLPLSRQIVTTAEGRTETLRVEWGEIELLSPVKVD